MDNLNISIICNLVATCAFVLFMMGLTWFNDIKAKWFTRYWGNVLFKWTYMMAVIQLFLLSFGIGICYHNNWRVLDYFKW